MQNCQSGESLAGETLGPFLMTKAAMRPNLAPLCQDP